MRAPVTIDPKVKEAADAYDAFLWRHGDPAKFEGGGSPRERYYEDQSELFDALLSAVRTAHLQELAGETERETLEKAAKAIRESDREAYGDDDEPVSWEESDEKSREDYRRVARAA